MVAIASVYRAILGGSRDHTLADDPALSCEDAAEVLLLLERSRGSRSNQCGRDFSTEAIMRALPGKEKRE